MPYSQAQTLVRIHDVARRVIEVVEKKRLFNTLLDHNPGRLRVDPIDGWTLLEVELGTVELEAPHYDMRYIEDTISERLDTLSSDPNASKDYSVGATSGDYRREWAGAVRLRDFQLVYASLSENPMADEAIVLTIAVRAGLLTKKNVTQRGRLNPRSDYFNPHLKQLLAHCNWTN